MTRILIVDDIPANLRVLVDALEPQGHEVLTATSGGSALALCERVQPDLVLLDVMLGAMDGIAVCRRLKAMPGFADVPVIFITGMTDWEHLQQGFEAGGADYVTKPFRAEEVLLRIGHHLRLGLANRLLAERNAELSARMGELEQAHRALLAETEKRRETEHRLEAAGEALRALHTREADRLGLAAFVGHSPALQASLAEIRQVNQGANINVLVTGESGTGKELAARAIHLGSPRARQPFVTVNCVAITADLAESMFFGHVKGAFTGATSDHKGHFEMAHGGTLFLDEIGDMPPGLQAKLLRVLEDGIVRPVGSRREVRTDVRVVAATNADLSARIVAGQFREDLFYRLARFQLVLPPLRDRPQDIAPLARHFARRFAEEMSVRVPGIDADALQAIARERFPGNVRELRNRVERALIRWQADPLHDTELHSRHFAVDAPVPQAILAATTPTVPIDGVPFNLREAETHLMQRALRHANGNVSEAARLLGIHRSKLYRVLG